MGVSNALNARRHLQMYMNLSNIILPMAKTVSCVHSVDIPLDINVI